MVGPRGSAGPGGTGIRSPGVDPARAGAGSFLEPVFIRTPTAAKLGAVPTPGDVGSDS